jgi:hypothetical protein
MNRSDQVRPSCRTVLICLAITALGALRVAAEPATAPHGAMPMQEQRQRLDYPSARGDSAGHTCNIVRWAAIATTLL